MHADPQLWRYVVVNVFNNVIVFMNGLLDVLHWYGMNRASAHGVVEAVFAAHAYRRLFAPLFARV